MAYIEQEIRPLFAHPIPYASGENGAVKAALDRRVRVAGSYEAAENQKPGLTAVTSIEVLDDPARQFDIRF